MIMNKQKVLTRAGISAILFVAFTACQKEAVNETEQVITATTTPGTTGAITTAESVLLVIDEESIDNGNLPNMFSEIDVNDQLARIGLRQSLRYFRENTGDTIVLYTGDVGDEGWHTVKTIPVDWKTAGPGTNGASNFIQAGPGLGGGNGSADALLDKIPNVTPLRATGLKMLTGKTVLAVVYDGDVSINYGPLNGSLQGANLGLVALEVLQVQKRTNGSSASLPKVTVRIVRVEAATAVPLKLFSNAPVPLSSSEPFDIDPPATVPAIILVDAP